MTINAPAAIMLAFYVVAAERPACRATSSAGTIQADILKEYIAQKEWCFPVDPAMRLLGDMIEWCTRNMPRWHPVSISGYHIREAGSTAAQELAFTLKNGLTYVEQPIERGIDVDDFAPRLSFFFNAQIDFFEEIAKYRAARRIWARELRDTYGAKNPSSRWLMRFHTQTAGRLADGAAAAQQHRAHRDRGARRRARRHPVAAHQLATTRRSRCRPRTRSASRCARSRSIAHETGVTNTADPLGGSYFVEALTDRMEAQAYDYFRRIDELGGMVESVKRGLPAARDRRRELRAAERDRRRRPRRRRRQPLHRGRRRRDRRSCGSTRTLERKQIDRLQAVRARRDGAAVEERLARLREAAAVEDRNLMPLLIECARVHASEGEIVERSRRSGATTARHPSTESATMPGAMPPRLAFDPISEARRQWEEHWGDEAAPPMVAVTSIMRVAAAPARAAERAAQAVGADVPALRGADAPVLLAPRVAAAREDGRPAPGPPRERDQRHRPARGAGAGAARCSTSATGAPCSRRSRRAAARSPRRPTRTLNAERFGTAPLGDEEAQKLFDLLLPMRVEAGDF